MGRWPYRRLNGGHLPMRKVMFQKGGHINRREQGCWSIVGQSEDPYLRVRLDGKREARGKDQGDQSGVG